MFSTIKTLSLEKYLHNTSLQYKKTFLAWLVFLGSLIYTGIKMPPTYWSIEQGLPPPSPGLCRQKWDLSHPELKTESWETLSYDY